jgi:exopolyphosphatase/guanosine-5'-triphosphate,3'-diphosphate pyrophosphatase
MLDRARILAAATRAAYVISGAMSGVLPLTPLNCTTTTLILTLPRGLADLASERLQNRLKHLGRLIGREPAITIAS